MLTILTCVGVIIVTLIIYSYVLGYDEKRYNFITPQINLFEKAKIKQFIMEDLYVDIQDDSIYVLRKQNQYQLIVWNIERYKNLNPNRIKENSTMRKKMGDAAYYTVINVSKRSQIEIKSKIKFSADETVNLFINNPHIYQKEQGKNYIFYAFEMQQFIFVTFS